MKKIRKILIGISLILSIALLACGLTACAGDAPVVDLGGKVVYVHLSDVDLDGELVDVGAVAERRFYQDEGNKIDPVELPGYTFLGYYTADGIEFFDSQGKQIEGNGLAGDLHVYAQYEQTKYTIVYTKWSNSQQRYVYYDKVEDITYGQKLEEFYVPEAPYGEEFVGWAKDKNMNTFYSNGGTPIVDVFNSSYNYLPSGQSASIPDENGNKVSFTSAVVFYPVFDVAHYDITLVYGGNSSSYTPPVASETVVAEHEQTLDDLSVSSTNNSKIWYDTDAWKVVGWATRSGQTLDSSDLYDTSKQICGDLTLYAIWEQYRYEVRLNYNNVTLNPSVNDPDITNMGVQTIGVEKGSSLSSVQVGNDTYTEYLTRKQGKWRVLKWVEVNGSSFDTSRTLTGDIVLYAVWEQYQFTITLNYGSYSSQFSTKKIELERGQSLEDMKGISSTYNKYLTEKTTTHEITGWTTQKGSNTAFDMSAGVTNDATLYAIWDQYNFTVTLDYGYDKTGYQQQKIHVLKNQSIATTAFDNSLIDGYLSKDTGKSKIVGWSKSPSFTPYYNTGTTVTEDFTLYAVWEEYKYTVTLNLGTTSGPNGTIEYFTVEKGTAMDSVLPAIDGYVSGNKAVRGWTTDPSATNIVAYTANGGRVTSDVTIWGVWAEFKEATFYLNDENTQSVRMKIFREGTNGILPQVDDGTKLGYRIRGWYDNAGRSGTVKNTVVFADVKANYYSEWRTAEYTVKFIWTEGNSSQTNTQTYTYGNASSIYFLTPTVTNPNNYFVGWYRTADFKGSPVSSLSNSEYGDITLYGKIIPYSTTFNLYKNSSLMESVVVNYDSSYVLPIPKLAANQRFLGWANSSGQLITDESGASLSNWTQKEQNGSFNVYAKYETLYKITFSYVNPLTSETVTPVNGYYRTGERITLRVPNFKGYTCTGIWISSGRLTSDSTYTLTVEASDMILGAYFSYTG